MIKVFFSFIFGIIFAFIYETIGGSIAKNIFNTTALVVYGYKLHHSLYGILFLSIYFINRKSFYLGFGLGIIFQHTITDGFRFMQKV